ncbi:hypothetical protein LEP1GSC060_2257 [Leptospira weilii serovar Ranarum str. ICFT]|uniref:Uncharacterized protein n=1 Tax=Leptospira weilii serovar Ranarum str. ICFT TaxID=1218598 RepID=N1W745_9LEPT|nr:hypothetical protein LEP1GSC060_2257 [Leptospira weilii serovar Ranarum str. ICFT]
MDLDLNNNLTDFFLRSVGKEELDERKRFALSIADLVMYPLRSARWNFQGPKKDASTKVSLEEKAKEWMDAQETVPDPDQHSKNSIYRKELH